ncbi:ABC transporter ATP-binding protein [Gemella sp. GH3]|uniref:ABC transporter ATP-binding protein n=1 Tax=unclassified Gemella TaxID=2624949 RepID=UPI0015D08C18|nr:MULTISPECIES: ABC transporter ATP-binding protein [unclassified Gemella]MBF0713706.1 ABC transporter ATP-binding protein [Gemella sp. GH3.1]NYS50658.1 ABC transporter ATP-binding protein [Gemella sp. GH3]
MNSSVLHLFKRDKTRVFIVSITSIIGNLLTLYPITRVSFIIDNIASETITYNDVVRETIILLFVGLLKYIVMSLNDFFTFFGYDRNIKYMGEDIQKSIYKQTPIFFNKFSIGEVISRSTNDISDYVSPLVAFGLFCFLEGVIYNGYITVLIFLKSNVIYTLLVILPYIVQTIYLSKRKKGQEVYYDKMLKTMDTITEETLENVKGIRVIRTYNLLPKVKRSFIAKLNTYSENNVEYTKKIKLFQPINMISSAVSYLIAIVYGFYLIKIGSMTLGELISVFLVLAWIQWPYIALSQFIISYVEARQGLKRISEVTNYPVIVNNDKANGNFEFLENIEFKNFNFKYESDYVLKDINFVINKGETIGIVGKTGSGKSTLVKQLLRLYPTEENTILLDGKSIEQFYDYSIRDKMGVALQEHQLFSKTLKDNVLFYRYDLEDKLEESLIISDLKKDVASFKDGINTLIGENGLSLSGGQKQRIGIARAVIGNPGILILDDSLSAVDASTEENIIKNIRNSRVDKTNIIVSHRISAVRHADKIIVLSNGIIEQIGTHNELLQTCKWYNELNEYQNKEVKNDEE